MTVQGPLVEPLEEREEGVPEGVLGETMMERVIMKGVDSVQDSSDGYDIFQIIFEALFNILKCKTLHYS